MGGNLHPAELIIAIQAMQALAGIVLAGLLLIFYRTHRQAFLAHWALSAAALTVYLGASALALGAAWIPGNRLLRTVASAISLAAAYPHVVWLMIGTWEALNRRTLTTRTEIWLVGGAAVFGLASVALTAFVRDPGELRFLLRVDLRYLFTGVAFTVAGFLLWRARRSTGLVGARLGAIAFLLFGLQMLHVVAVNFWVRAGHPPPFYAAYIGLLDFLFQSLIALGLVVWLLEIQRQRTDRAQDRLVHARRHDPTTGLPNRAALLEQITEMIERTGTRKIAIMSLGVNRYFMLSRALGWQQAEQLMNRIVDRVHRRISHRCALGRISDRDLLIVRPTLDGPEKICVWAEQLLRSIVHPVRINDEEVFVTFCVGISIYPDDSRDPDELIQQSRHALIQSTRIGRDATLFQRLGEQAGHGVVALRFETELRQALEERQFELHYQPIVDPHAGRLCGHEALLRWRHPDRGVLGPGDFLDEVANIGLLDKLEFFVLDSALRQAAAWGGKGGPDWILSINLSARRFAQHGLVERLLRQCEATGVDPHRLALEITENTAIQDLQSAAGTIARLQRAGIRVSLDDFGTGYSSLANLLKLKVDQIKLDRMFLENIESDADQRQLVAAMIRLGHSLGTTVVAEGVERRSQLEFLIDRKCDCVQGFLIQKPLPAADCRLDASLITGLKP